MIARRWSARQAYVAAVLLVALVVLSGCAGRQVTHVTRAQSKQAMIALVDETVKILPVGGWKVVQSPYEEDCTSDNGGKVFYVYGRVGDTGKTPEADAERVAALWKKHGMTVRIIYVGGTEEHIPQVYAEGGPVTRMSFLANPEGYAVSGSSLCVP